MSKALGNGPMRQSIHPEPALPNVTPTMNTEPRSKSPSSSGRGSATPEMIMEALLAWDEHPGGGHEARLTAAINAALRCLAPPSAPSEGERGIDTAINAAVDLADNYKPTGIIAPAASGTSDEKRKALIARLNGKLPWERVELVELIEEAATRVAEDGRVIGRLCAAAEDRNEVDRQLRADRDAANLRAERMRKILAPTFERLAKSDAAWLKASGALADDDDCTISVPLADIRKLIAALSGNGKETPTKEQGGT